jgi:uncharacterized protein (DUF2252 family)
MFRVSKNVGDQVMAALVPYRETISPDRQRVLDAYHPVDVIFKVAGIGSMGTRIYIVLCLGNGPEDALFLQLKQQLPSCYAPFVRDVEATTHQGRRVAEGQRLLQATTDPFLGWTTIDGNDFLVRQSAERKASVDPTELKGEALTEFGYVCGQILANAHARSGDAAQIKGYCGRSDRLDKALAQFAATYAEQSARDQEALLAAIKAGRIKAAY